MRLEVIKNFVSNEQAAALNRFVLGAVKNGLFVDGVASRHLNKPGAHMVSRFNKSLEYPQVAYEVRNKIIDCFGFTESMIFKRFNNSGIAVNCSFKNGQLWKHRDASEPGYGLVRCTVVTSQPAKGGIFHVQETPVLLNETDLYACLVSEHEHFCTQNEDEKPRIVWQFGFNVNSQAWNNGTIKVNNGLS